MAVYTVTPQDQYDIAGLYAAFWNRAPDTTGFGFWVEKLASGVSLDEIATAFRNAPEGVAEYPLWSTNVELVTEVYANVFGRAPDTQGLLFWTGKLDSGQVTFPELVVDMCEAAMTNGSADGALFENKVEVGVYVATVAQTDNGYVCDNAFNQVTADPASVATAEAWVDANNTGATYTLTTNIDTINVDGHAVNTVVGVQSVAGSTFNTGDTVNGNGLTKVSLTVTGDGDAVASGSIVDLNNIASVNINLAQSAVFGPASIDALEYTNVAQVAVTNGVAGRTLLANNAQLETAYTLANNGRANTLTVNSYTNDLSGKADVSSFAVAGTGTDAANSTLGTAVAGIESNTLATSGVNFVTLNSSADTKAITITGNGTNDITIGTANGTLLVDASATTGDNVIDMVNHLSGVSDTIKGGSGADVVVANISNTTASTITGVETLDLAFTAPSLFNASKVVGVDTLLVDNTAAATFSQLASTVNLVAFDTAAAGAGATLGFASGTANDLEVDVGLVTDLGTSTAAVGTGNLTVSGNAGTVAVHSLSDKATTVNTVGALDVGTATELTINAESAALTVGGLVGTKVTSLDVEATKAAVTVGGFAAATGLTTLTANATKGNVALGTVRGDSSLTSIVVSAAGDATVDRTLTLTVDNAAALLAADKIVTSLTVGAGEGDVTVTSGATIATAANTEAFIGTVDATAATGSVTLNFAAYTGAGNYSINLGDAATGEVNSVDISAATGAAVITGGTGADSIVSGAGADILNTGAGADTVFGGAGADVIDTDAGNDLIVGGAGADIINGGTGTNTASYLTSAADVQVSLVAGAINTGGDAAGDVLSNIQNLTGSNNGLATEGDALTGDANNNVITGLAGGDSMVGGAGSDTFAYTGATFALEVAQTHDAAGIAAIDVDYLSDFVKTADSIDFSVAGSVATFTTGAGIDNANYAAALVEANAIFGAGGAALSYVATAYGAGAAWSAVMFIDSDGAAAGTADGAILIGTVGSYTTEAAALAAIAAANII